MSRLFPVAAKIPKEPHRRENKQFTRRATSRESKTTNQLAAMSVWIISR